METFHRTVFLGIQLLLGVYSLVVPVTTMANVICDEDGRNCRDIRHYRTQQQALDACAEFSLSIGYTENCSAGGLGPVFLVSKGWLWSGGPDSKERPAYLLSYYYGFEQRNECPNEVGNPMDFTNGIKYQTEVDYRSSGPHPLTVERVYSSRIVGYAGTSVNKNWRFNFELHLDATQSLSDNRIVLIRPDQSVLFFSKDSGGNWVADSDTRLQITGVTASGGQTGWQITDRYDTVERYDITGQLQSIQYKDGYTQNYTYQDTILTISDSFNRTLTVEFDADGVVQSFTDPAGQLYTYEYNSNGLLQSVVFPDDTPSDDTDNPQRIYHYEYLTYRQFLTGITDERGVRYVTWQYSQTKAIVSKNPDDVNKARVTYNSSTQSTVTNALGKETTYYYQDLNGTQKVVNVEGQPSSNCAGANKSYTYDANGNIDTKTDWNGNITDYNHNARGLIESKIEAVGTDEARTTTTQWHATLHLPTQIIEPGKTTTYVYDDANGTGNLLSQTETDTTVTPNVSRTTAYTYNSHGQVLTVDGPRTDVTDITVYTYDSNGNRNTVTNALNQVTQLPDYDAHGNVLTIIDSNNVRTELTYDARQRLLTRTVAATTADAATTTFDYDPVGNLTRITQSTGAYLDYSYDDANRLTAIEDNLGNRIVYTLDNAGNRTAQQTYNSSDVLVQTQTVVFDELSRMINQIGAASQTTGYTYDNNGNATAITDPRNSITTQSFDALNRLISIQDPINGASALTEYVYDDQDNLTSVTDPEGNITTYTYNGFGEVISQTSPNTGTTTYTYDAAGNRLSQTDARNITVQYHYDTLDRLTGIEYPDSSENIAYTYDQTDNGNIGIGRLTRIDDASGSTQYRYDRRGNVVEVTTTITIPLPPGEGEGEGIFTTHYAYDLADNLIKIIYPDGRSIDYTRNVIGQITEVRTTFAGQTQTLASGIDYQAFGPLKGLTYGNGLMESRSYDLDGRLDLLNNGVQSFDYDYDPNSNIETLSDLIDENQSQNYIYDLLDRLTDAEGGYGEISYGYDGVGNRLSYSDGTNTDSYVYRLATQQLDNINGNTNVTYDYDAVGNTISRNSDVFTYNDANRLETASVNEITTSYRYNALGQRVVKANTNETVLYLYDLNGRLIAEAGSDGTIAKEYVYLNDERLVMISASQSSGSGAEFIIDNSDAGFSTTGDWSGSTAITGYQGSNYQYLAANDVPPGTLQIDNGATGFSTLGNWTNSTAISGYQGSHYQVHAANGIPVGGLELDNSEGSAIGAWPSSSAVIGYTGSNYQFHAAGSGDNSFSWTPNLSGEYQIYARWTSHANRASNATYTITHSAGTDNISVNQKQNGGVWNLLGTYTLDTSSTITLTDDADGYVIADGIQFVPVDAAPNTATWAVGSSGQYDVYANWTAHANRASNATYTVYHRGGTTRISVNQQQMGGQFNLLGSFTFEAGQNHRIELTDQANGYVIADAIRFVGEDTTPNQAVWTPNVTGDYEIYANWTAHPNRATDATYTVNHAGGSTSVTVNQQANGGQWNLLGTYTLNSSSTISLSDQVSGYVIADALRFVNVGTTQTADVYYYHSDHLNTPQVMTDRLQQVVWQANYSPFGKADITVDDVVNNVRFPGQYFDQETNLHYNYFRYYDPATGRYITSDPIGLSGGINNY
ncbi:MAG: RHS domain-containing protein, partial [Gammaproteobacteria bacterium]|nr:RHS domain-containing protein [Gammaproteobacteria bacterium]